MRPVLLGMNNPLAVRPEVALWPSPVNSTGHRIWSMLNDARLSRPPVSRREYVRAFDRRNLVTGSWTPLAARRGARRLDVPAGGTVVVFGRATWEAVADSRGLPEEVEWVLPVVGADGTRWRAVPHPSGRNRWYNDPANVLVVAMLLRELYDEWHRGNQGA